MQGYPEGHRPQQSSSLSPEKSGQGVGGEVQDAGLAQYDMQMHSARLCEQTGLGASSGSCPVRCCEHGRRC
jgi:hypothetical protein